MATKRKKSAGKRLKNQLVDLVRGNIDEPKIDGVPEKLELVKALNYYNAHTDTTQRKAWSVQWASTHRPKLVRKIEAAPLHHFQTYAALARMALNGVELESGHTDRMVEFFEALPEEVKEEPKPRRKRRTAVNPTLEAMDAALDTCIEESRYIKPNFAVSSGASAAIEFCETELRAVENDPAAHPTWYKRWLKYAIRHLNDAAPKKRTRKKKVVKPADLVKRMKFCKRDPDTGVESQPPEKIVGAKTVYLYNVKLRRIIHLVAVANETLSVKGSTIENVDFDKSAYRIVRKPEVTFTDGGKWGILAARRAYKAQKTKEQKMTALQVRQNILILAVA